MRNNLPILLAFILMAVAAMPWLRSLETQQWSSPTRTTTVPPPEQAITQAIPAGSTQDAVSPPDKPISQPSIPAAAGPIPPTEHTEYKESRLDNGASTLPKPQSLVDSAVRTVETRQFISARVKQQGELFGLQITGEGHYYELRQGPIPQMHLELTMEIGSVSTSLVQKCNGRTFWTYRKMPAGESLSKIDAVRAITALEQAKGKLPKEAMNSAPGLGGLGRLMRGLNARFEFTSVAAEQLGGLPVWKLSGGWRPEQLARLLPNQKAAIEKGRTPDLNRLPGHLPNSVTLFLGQEDCFPFRIEYLRNVPNSSPRGLMELEFFELNFNGPIDSGEFIFSPGNLPISDRTDEFVRSLGEGG